jgi:CRP-like cAMP-binding protein
MISLIVAMVEDCALEVGTVGKEGAIGLITGIGSHISAVRALVQVSGSAWRIPAARFASASARSPRIRAMIARYSDAILAQVQQTAACNALHAAAPRVGRWLLQTSDTIDSDRIPFTQEFLGEMLGVQRTTVSEVIRRFQDAGLVETRYREIRITDRGKLRREACECYDIIRKHMDRMIIRP